MDARCRIELLGGLKVSQGERIISRFQTRKTALLLAYLALHLSKNHSRELLIEMLWPEVEPKTGRHRLSMALSSLRRQLEPPGLPIGTVIVADRLNVRLNPIALTTDVIEFEAALHEAHSTRSGGHVGPPLQRAIALYGGPLLPGFYEDWIMREQDRLANAYVQAIRRLIDELEDAGDWEQAITYARRAISADPLREEAHQELIRLLAEDGQSAAALRRYQELERILRQELGVPPSEVTHALIEQPDRARQKGRGHRRRPILPATPPALASSIAPHEGRDERGRRSMLNASLPLQFTRFFGREQEIAHLVERLSPITPDKLLTLTGSGGVGKTRLAVEVAGRLIKAFAGGIWFVPLADVMQASRIPDALVDALGLTRSSDVEPLEQVVDHLNRCSAPELPPTDKLPGETGRPPFSEGQTLETFPLLLLLDNFEQMAPHGAQVVGQLRARVPNLTCLITSRRRLGLTGERTFSVGPLPTPEEGREDSSFVFHPASLLSFPSVQLFVDRAQAVRPDFQITQANAQAVADLCSRLEGLPLAIELAAARSATLTPAQMLAQLASRFDLLVGRKRGASGRHQTLRATLDWSYHLLGPSLQRFFARLSVFRGGWTVEAAAAVCEEPSALDEIARLRDCSLVVAEEASTTMRFRMPETLREYAEEQLTLSECAALHRRHAEHFLSLAKEAAQKLDGPEQAVWLDRLETEHDNLRAALAWSLKGKDEGGRIKDEPTGIDSSFMLHPSEIGLRLVVALSRFWRSHGYLSEGRERLTAALGRKGAQARTALRANALNAAGVLAYQQGDHALARACHEEGLAICWEIGDRASEGRNLINLGNIARQQGDYALARACHEEGLAICREIKDRRGMASALHNLGMIAQEQGDYVPARSCYEQALLINREQGNRLAEGNNLNSLGNTAHAQGDYVAARSFYEQSLAINCEMGSRLWEAEDRGNLGLVASSQGDYALARSHYEQALLISREVGARDSEAHWLGSLGVVASDLGDYPAARTLYEQALVIHREVGNRPAEAHILSHLGILETRQGRYGAARSLLVQSLSMERELGIKSETVHSLGAFASLSAAEERLERAIRLWGAAKALRDALGEPLSSEEYERDVSAARETLGAEIGAARWAEGYAMTMEQAITYALEE